MVKIDKYLTSVVVAAIVAGIVSWITTNRKIKADIVSKKRLDRIEDLTNTVATYIENSSTSIKTGTEYVNLLQYYIQVDENPANPHLNPGWAESENEVEEFNKELKKLKLKIEELSTKYGENKNLAQISKSKIKLQLYGFENPTKIKQDFSKIDELLSRIDNLANYEVIKKNTDC
ncbi:hypothetical protein MGY74_002572, partial [Enterococcus faecalis]|nr:hypothetical protein [Enterococcus faecalis]